MNKHFFTNSECCSCDKNKLIVLNENKCQIVFENASKKEIYKVRVDDCIITSGKRCDFLVVDPNNYLAWFIELKGQDFLYAIEQINRSIDLLINNLQHTDINARIVLTKVNTPDLMNNPNLLKFEKRIKKLNGTVKKGTIKMREKI